MSEGQRTAQETKGVIKDLGHASEDVRKNINSFADNLLGGNKTHASTGIHPDAKVAGDELVSGIDSNGKKVDGATTIAQDPNKRA